MIQNALADITELLRDIRDMLRTSPWLNAVDAARYCHMKAARMRELMASGDIPSHKVGMSNLVHKDDLDAWVRSQPSRYS